MNQVSTNNSEPQPEWIEKILQRHKELNQRYDKAHELFSEAYNEFLMIVDEINEQHGTEFTFEQAAIEFQGDIAYCPTPDAEDDDDREDD